jgi:hypothetical protein
MGFIYKTTNLINGKWYIGKHERNDSNYFGSGKLLSLAIKKYGKENFKREILAESNNTEELNNLEIKFIRETNAIKDPMSYNIAAGGKGGNTYAGLTELEIKNAVEKAQSKKEKHYTQYMNDFEYQEYVNKKIESFKNTRSSMTDEELSNWENNRINGFKNRTLEEETERRKNISKSRLGEKNHNFGKKMSADTKEKLSKSKKSKTYEDLMGSELAQIVKKRMSDNRKGKKRSKEFCEKQSENRKGKSLPKLFKTYIVRNIITGDEIITSNIRETCRDLKISYWTVEQGRKNIPVKNYLITLVGRLKNDS